MTLRHDDQTLGQMTLAHLEQVVAIDSQSDETSQTIPSSEGQRQLSQVVAEVWKRFGLAVESDDNANVIGTLPGRGAGVDAAPLALMVHIDTARGTAAVPRLEKAPRWDGTPVKYPANAALQVDVATYPQLGEFLGQTIVHGPGDAPFGLDDKLGLAHLMTLARVLSEAPELAHPPLLFIGRPDEEIGRMGAVEGLARLLAERGVRSGYTVDGILPFEVNTANFNGAHATLTFAADARAVTGEEWALELRGVNTHGATAHAEGHRAATRFMCEVLAEAPGTEPLWVASDALRDCDGVILVSGAHSAIDAAARAVTSPHVARGAGYTLRQPNDSERAFMNGHAAGAVAALLDWTRAFLASAPGFPLLAEDSYGWLGYSHPYRARVLADGSAELDVRIRDFDKAGLEARKQHIAARAGDARAHIRDQYVNMGPQLASLPTGKLLAEQAIAAAHDVGVVARTEPIRGGTGVDPFLDHGTAVANIGTGYFAPESEKELTSVELMAGHARWLIALVGRLAAFKA